MLAATAKGVLVEIEYAPCVIPNGCNQILQEFAGNHTHSGYYNSQNRCHWTV